MKVLGIRFCSVAPEARQLAAFLENLGLPRRELGECADEPAADAPFSGAVFPAGDHSWIEIWEEGPEMPAGIMLQLIVDDADAFAAHARDKGLVPQGPVDLHGERIYFVTDPSGMQISFQSRSNEGASR